jgi:hypothetical protein
MRQDYITSQTQWPSSRELDLDGDFSTLRDSYIKTLQNTFATPTEQQDQLIWSQKTLGGYVPKICYITLAQKDHMGLASWWGKTLLKLKFLPNQNISCGYCSTKNPQPRTCSKRDPFVDMGGVFFVSKTVKPIYIYF